jgi:hypothetical protein
LEPRNLLNDTIANAGYFYNTCDLALSSNICPIPLLVRFPRTLYAPQPKSSLYLHSRIPSGLPSNPLVRQVSLHKSCSPKSEQRRPEIRHSPPYPKSNPLFQRHDQNSCHNRYNQEANAPKPCKPQQHPSERRTGFVSRHYGLSMCKFSPCFDRPRILKYS